MSTTKRFLSSEHTMIISASAGAQTIHRDLRGSAGSILVLLQPLCQEQWGIPPLMIKSFFDLQPLKISYC